MLLVAVTACALAPATASAALPRPASTAIVPGKSIGGVSIGMTVKRALARWGAGSHCTAATIRRSCTWTGTGTQGTVSFNVGFTGKVRSITIAAGHNERSHVYTGPLQELEDEPGDAPRRPRPRAVVKAYPKVHSSRVGPAARQRHRARRSSRSPSRPDLADLHRPGRF